MKKKSITILSVLLVILSLCFLGDGISGAADGWNDASHDLKQKPEKDMHRVEVSLNPIKASAFPDTLLLSSGKQIPYGASAITLKVEEPAGYTTVSMTIMLIITPLLIWLFVWGCVSFFQFIHDIQKGKIFIPLNVRRLRVIAGFLFLAGLLINLTSGLDYYYLIKDNGIEVPGYQIVDFHFQHQAFFIALFFALFAEIFALGVKMKEEQDLTV